MAFSVNKFTDDLLDAIIEKILDEKLYVSRSRNKQWLQPEVGLIIKVPRHIPKILWAHSVTKLILLDETFSYLNELIGSIGTNGIYKTIYYWNDFC